MNERLIVGTVVSLIVVLVAIAVISDRADGNEISTGNVGTDVNGYAIYLLNDEDSTASLIEIKSFSSAGYFEIPTRVIKDGDEVSVVYEEYDDNYGDDIGYKVTSIQIVSDLNEGYVDLDTNSNDAKIFISKYVKTLKENALYKLNINNIEFSSLSNLSTLENMSLAYLGNSNGIKIILPDSVTTLVGSPFNGTENREIYIPPTATPGSKGILNAYGKSILYLGVDISEWGHTSLFKDNSIYVEYKNGSKSWIPSEHQGATFKGYFVKKGNDIQIITSTIEDIKITDEESIKVHMISNIDEINALEYCSYENGVLSFGIDTTIDTSNLTVTVDGETLIPNNGIYTIATNKTIIVRVNAELPEWTVTFMDGNAEYEEYTIVDGQTLESVIDSLPEPSSGGGKRFLYWHLENNTEAFEINTPINGNVVLYAKWESTDAHTISYYSVTGTLTADYEPVIDEGWIANGGKVTFEFSSPEYIEVLSWIVTSGASVDKYVVEGTYDEDGITISEDGKVFTIGDVKSDIHVTIDLRYIGTSNSPEPVVSTATPTTNDTITLDWKFHPSMITEGMYWEGQTTVPLIVDNFVYTRAAGVLYKIDSDTGLVVKSVETVISNTYFQYLGYLGNGLIVDYETDKVYNMDLEYQNFKIAGRVFTDENTGYVYGYGDISSIFKYDVNDYQLDSKGYIIPIWSWDYPDGTSQFTWFGSFPSPVILNDSIFWLHGEGDADSDQFITTLCCLSGIDSSEASGLSFTSKTLNLGGRSIDDGWLTTDGKDTLYVTSYRKNQSSLMSIIKLNENFPGLNESTETVKTFTKGGEYTSAFVVYGNVGFVNSGTTMLAYEVREDGTVGEEPIASCDSVKSHGSIVVSSHYEKEGYLYIYIISYSTATLSIFEYSIKDKTMVSTETIVAMDYCSQAVRSTESGKLVFYTDGSGLFCYTIAEKKQRTLLVNDNNDTKIGATGYGENTITALNDTGYVYISTTGTMLAAGPDISKSLSEDWKIYALYNGVWIEMKNNLITDTYWTCTTWYITNTSSLPEAGSMWDKITLDYLQGYKVDVSIKNGTIVKCTESAYEGGIVTIWFGLNEGEELESVQYTYGDITEDMKWYNDPKITTPDYEPKEGETNTVGTNPYKYSLYMPASDITITIKTKNERVVSLNKTTLELAINGEETLTAIVDSISVGEVTWSSDKPNVASVDNDGKVTGRSVGIAVITATINGDSASCEVTVSELSVSLNKTELKLKLGQEEILMATVIPTGTSEVTWSSEDPAVASVDNNGKVTGISLGETVITATVLGKSAVCEVTVYEDMIPATDINIDQTKVTMEGGTTKTLVATLTPYDSTSSITWTSSATWIVEVNDGVLTPKSVGSATITAEANGLKAECIVIVEYGTIAISPAKVEMEINTTRTVSVETTSIAVWSSADKKIVTITRTGNTATITGVSEGVTTISVIVDELYKGTANVEVTKASIATYTFTIKMYEDYKTVSKNFPKYLEEELKNGFEIVGVGTDAAEALQDACDKNEIPVYLVYTMDDNGNELKGWIGTLFDLGDAKDENQCWTYWAQYHEGSYNDLTLGYYTGGGNFQLIRMTTDSTGAMIKYVSNVEIDHNILTMDIGEEKTLMAIITPSDAYVKDVNWTSSDTSVATVDNNGKVTAISSGEVTITVTTHQNDYTATCLIRVSDGQIPTEECIPVSNLTIDKEIMTLTEGGMGSLTATMLPIDATDKSVIWHSENTSVAIVDANGTVRAIKAGTTLITVKTTDGSELTASCIVTVKATSKIFIAPTIDNSGGHTMATVTEEQMEDAVDKANDTDDGIIPVINIDAISDNVYDKIVISIPFIGLDDFIEAEGEIIIETSIGTIALDSDIVSEISRESGDTFEITIENVDTSSLNEKQKGVVRDNIVVKITAKIGGQKITTLNGNVTITLPYELESGQDSSRLVVWFMEDNGNTTDFVCAYDTAKKTVTFVTNHFSYYVVVYLADDIVQEDNDNIMLYVAIAAIVLIALLLGAFLYMRSKKTSGA